MYWYFNLQKLIANSKRSPPSPPRIRSYVPRFSFDAVFHASLVVAAPRRVAKFSSLHEGGFRDGRRRAPVAPPANRNDWAVYAVVRG